jgi:hypothetical protein
MIPKLRQELAPLPDSTQTRSGCTGAFAEIILGALCPAYQVD